MKEYLTPVSTSVIAHREVLPVGTLGKQIELHSEAGVLPAVTKAKFAIFGIRENRNDINYNGDSVNFESFRKALYSLYPGNWAGKIIDLGDIDKGDTLSDTYFAVKQVTEELLLKKVIPIILGGSQDMAYVQYRAYDAIGKMVNYVNIDSRFDLGDAEQPINNKSYVGKIIVEEPYNLFNYSTIGYQSYYNPPQEIILMDKLYFDAYRLGDIVADIKGVEPLLRDADLVTLDATSIKGAFLQRSGNESPNGFDSREICAVSRYAGISNKVSSFGVYELNGQTESKGGAMLIAQIIWYFIEGVNFRVKDDDFNNENFFTTYNVPIDDEVLIFKKSNKTGRWWVELPFISEVNNKLKRHTLLPCTYGDYLGAIEQEIPERWYKARRKNEV
ncbi:formiminoglutamase-related protein [unidentified eubacterium SCB49]|nr:formiminoglutamase-related protein [unidentified eubacterium SCB49]